MDQIVLFFKKIYTPIQWIFATIGIIYLYEKFIRKPDEPKTVVNNDNSHNISVEKIKSPHGINDLTMSTTPVISEKDKPENILKKRLDEIKNHNKDKAVSNGKKAKLDNKLKKAVADNKPKKANRVKKRIEKRSDGL